MRKGGTVVAVALVFFAGACADSEAEPAAAPTVVSTAVPTTQEPPSNPPPTAAPTEPPATATPEASDEETAVIAAWERYLDLSIQARGRTPSAASTRLSGYMTAVGAIEFQQVLDDDRANGRYVTGSAISTEPSVEFMDPAAAIVDDCVQAQLTVISVATGETLSEQDETRSARARFVLLESSWVVAAFETGGICVL